MSLELSNAMISLLLSMCQFQSSCNMCNTMWCRRYRRNTSFIILQVHAFLINLHELLKRADEMGYKRRALQKSSATISLI